MIPKSETNDDQKSTHAVFEESKATVDRPSDDSRKKLRKTGTIVLIHYLMKFSSIFCCDQF